MMPLALLALLALLATPAAAQSLLVNGSAEEALVGGELPGWTEVVGSQWGRRSSSPSPYEGGYYFDAGSVPVGELAQDVDVTALAADIDAGLRRFRFSGWLRSYNQSPADTARVVVEYRDAGGAVLAAYDTGPTAHTTAWVAVQDERLAPAATRSVRVRLIADRKAGSNNDGYFDALRLVSWSDADAGAGRPARIEDLRAAGTGTAGEVRLTWTAPAAGHRRGLSPDAPALDCVEVAESGSTDSGVYWLGPEGATPQRAYCDLATGGGGWTMCYTDLDEVHVASEVTYDPERPYGTDGYRTDCRGVPFTDVLYVDHDGAEHAWFHRDAGAEVRLADIGYDLNGATLGTFTGHGLAAGTPPWQVMACDNQNWHPGIMVSPAGTCWKACGNWCSDTAGWYFRHRGHSYVGAAFAQPGHRDNLKKRLSVGLRRRAPLAPPAATAYDVRMRAGAIVDASPWEPLREPGRGAHEGTRADGGALTLRAAVPAQVDDAGRVLTFTAGLSFAPGVVATDGTWLYAKPIGVASPLFRIGTGQDGTVAGQVEDVLGPDTAASSSAAYLDGHVYVPVSGDPYSLQRLDVATGILDTVAVPDGLLRRDTGRVEAGNVVIGSDGEHLLCLAHAIEGGSLNGWRLRTYEIGPLGEPSLLDETLLFTASYDARSLLADGSVVIPLPWVDSSSTPRTIHALDAASLASVGTTALTQCSGCWDWDSPASGGYDAARGVFWVGDGGRPQLMAFPATRVTGSGAWTSPVRDFGGPVTLGAATWTAAGSVEVAARTSDDLVTWSAFVPVAQGGTPAVPAGRYAQVRVTLTGGAQAPSVRDLVLQATGDTWDQATTVATPTPGAPGTAEELVLTGVPAGDVRFAIRAMGSEPGPASNTAARGGAPAVTLDEPADGATVSGLVPVSVTATGAETVELRVDGVLAATLAAPDAPAAAAVAPRWRALRTVTVQDVGPGLSATTTVALPLDVAALVARGAVRPDLSDLRLVQGDAEVPRVLHADGTLRFRLRRPIPPNGADTYTLVLGGDPTGAAPDALEAVAFFHEDFEAGADRWTNLQGPWGVASVGGRVAMERAVTSDLLGGGVRAWLLQAEPGPLPLRYDLEALVRSPSGYAHAYWGFFLYGGDVVHNDTTYLGINHLVHHGWTASGSYTQIQSVGEPVSLDRWHRLTAQVRGAAFDTRLNGALTVAGRPGHLPAAGSKVGLWSEATYGAATAPSWTDDVTVWDWGLMPPLVTLGAEEPAPAAGATTWTWTWDTVALPAGAHALEARALDAFGAATTDTATVTVGAPWVPAPVLAQPADGALVDGTTVAVAGTAAAGATVAITVDGAPAGSAVAASAITRIIEAEDATITGGVVTGGAVHVGPWPGPSSVNVALGRPATANKSYNNNYLPSLAVDGRLEAGVGTYWLAPSGAKDAYVTVDLGAPHVVDAVRLANSRNAPSNDRSTKDYRLSVSSDGVAFTVVASGTLADDDSANWATATLAPPPIVRYVRFHADTYYGAGAGLGELAVMGTQAGAWAQVETPWLDLAGAEALAAFEALADGATHEVAVGGAWLPITALPGLPVPAGQVRLRTTLVRTSLAADPWVDRLRLDAVGPGSGAVGAFHATVPVTGGLHTVAATATLGGATSPAATATIDVDPAPPAAVTDLLAAPGAAHGSVVLTWTAPGDDGGTGTAQAYEIWRSTSPLSSNVLNVATVVPAPAPAAGGTPESVTVTGLSVGTTYHFMLQAIDDRGKAGALSNGTQTIPGDTTAPALTITAPAGGAHLRGVQALTCSTSDSSGVATVTWKVDGVEVAVATSPFAASIDTAGWADGAHAIEAVSRDTFGNATTKQVGVTFDNTAPLLSVDPVATPRATAAPVTYTASDNLTPLPQLSVLDQDGRAPPFVYPGEGPQTVTLTATDLAGNATSKAVSFLVDRTGPAAITDLAAAPGGGGMQLTWTAPADALTAVASYEVRVATEAAAGFGSGADGPLEVTGEAFVDAVRTPIVVDVAAGATTVPVVDTAGFAAGDVVLLLDAQGPAAAGTWALGRVAGVAGGALVLEAPLAEALPGTTDRVFAQRVPQHTDVTVYPGGRLTAHPWDGQTGGVVALLASGTVEVQAGGRIDATGIGFRGGPYSDAFVCKKKASGAGGEGALGPLPADQPNGHANGGGGALRTTCNDAAAGGGGGGAVPGTAGEDWGCNLGGKGGAGIGDDTLVRLFLGGGGGEGGADEDGGAPGYGGRGGGAVLLSAAGVELAGEVLARGAAGADACQGCASCGGYGCGMAGGGGGGGGAVLLRAGSVQVTVGAIGAEGGAGGKRTSSCGGNGGSGGAGRVRVEAPTVTGALPGATLGDHLAFDWAAATPVAGAPTPGAPGAPESMTATDLPAASTLHFAVRSRDTVGNLSPLSNVPSVDASPPTVAIVAPAHGATLTRPTAVLVTASDDVGIAEVRFAVDGAPAGALTAEPWRLDLDVRLLAPGPHTIEATAVDTSGLEATATITITAAPEAPAPPQVLTPQQGALVRSGTPAIGGAAEAWTTVHVYADGDLVASVPSTRAETLTWQAESAAVERFGLAVDGATVAVAPPGGTATNLALQPGVTVTGGSDPMAAVNGSWSPYWWQSWRTGAACSEVPTYLGRVALPQAALVDHIRLSLFGSNASYYGYRLEVSQDGAEWVTWADTAGSGLDYTGDQELTGTPRLVRYVDVYLTGSTDGCDAIVAEIGIFAATSGTGGVALMPLIVDEAATLATGFTATEDAGDGAITWEVQATGDLLADAFDGNAVDPERWTQSGVTVSGGVASLTGSGSWGPRYLIGARRGWRESGVVLEARLRPMAGSRSMVGLKDMGTGTSYTALIHGLYFNKGTLEIWEDGDGRGTFGPYTEGQWHDVRIVTGEAGATTWLRPDGGAWTQVYVSAYSTEPDLRAALVAHSGTVHADGVTLRARAWWPIARLTDPDLDPTRLRVRASLARPTAEAASPTIDVASILLSDGEAGAGPGAFRAVVPLADGQHTVTATCEDAAGTSAPSAPVTFTVDSGPPDAVTDLAATALPGGVVQLAWTAPASEPVATTLVYRSTAPIEDVSQLQPIASAAAAGFLDATNQSATLYYVVVAVDLVGNRSAPSNQASVASDKAGPTATAATNPPSPLGVGDAEVVFTLSEPVQGAPAFSFVPPGGAPVPLALTADSPTVWRGTLTVTQAMASGLGELRWAGVDLTGNAGTVVTSGKGVTIDTVLPTASVTLTPPPPLGPGTVAVKLLATEPLTSATLAFTPEGGAPVAVPLTGAGGLYQGSLVVDAALGDGTGAFAFQGIDAVGNVGMVLTKGATALVDTTPPPAPADLAAVKTPTGAIALTWTQPPGDTVAAWRVFRDRDPVVPGLAPILTVAAAQALDLPPADGLWHYAVAAVDAAGNASALSGGASVIASPPPPEDPTGLHVVTAGLTSLTVAWTPSVDSQGTLAGYRVYRDGALVQTLPGTATATSLVGLAEGVAVGLRVTAFDGANRESLGATLLAFTLVPNPSDLAADGQDGRVDLTWTASTSTAVLHQAIYVAEAPFASVAGLTPVATVGPGLGTASVSGLVNGQPLWLAVVAVNQSGLFDPLVAPAGATPADHEAPAPPTALKVLESLETSVVLGFTPSPAPDLAGYSLKSGGVQVAAVPAGQAGVSLTGLSPASSYALSLTAYDASGNESTAATVKAVTLLPNPGGVTLTPHDTSLGVTWSHAQPQGLVQLYRVYAEAAPFTSVTGLSPKATAYGTKATVKGLVNGQTTWVAVTTVNDSGGETQAVTPVAGVPADDAAPADPTGVIVTASDGSSVTLAWTAPPNPTGDLAGTRVYVAGALTATLAPTLTAHTLTGLSPGSSYAVRLTSFDVQGNESAGATLTVYTTLPNPPVGSVTPGHASLTLAWTPVTPAANVGSQALYVGSAPFVSVAGKAPAVVVGPTATSGKVVGLTNGQTAHVAVVTVSKSGGFDPAVTSVPGTPAKDTVGPTLGAVSWAGAPLPSGGTITGDGAFAVDATDTEGVAWVRFLVDGQSVGQDGSATGGWGVAWSPDAAGNGPHLLRLEAQDVHGNASSADLPFVVQLGPPGAPAITAPADGAVVGSPTLLVSGTAKAGSTVRVRVGPAVGATVVADPAGTFTTAVTLAQGPNTLTATAQGPGGEGAPSAPVAVTLDTVTPAAPKALTAKAGEAGAVALAWADAGSTPGGSAGYRVWRAAAPFTETAQATLVTPSPVTALSLTDLPPSDATWWYGVTKRSNAGLESPLSALASATSDSVPPSATLAWTPKGAAGGGKVGVGPLAVTATFTEPLLATPFLSLSPSGGSPLAVQLTKTSATTFTGTVAIDEQTASGTAWAVLSARDLAGNRGTQIDAGGSVLLDTHAPEVLVVATDPPSPVANDPQAPVTLAVTLTLDEALPPGVTPSLTWRLLTSHPEPEPVPVVATDPLTWVGGLTLPQTAGATPEALAFAWLAVDELGNESTTIHGASELEVYQGTLPPLPAPLGLVAKGLPGGHVQLTWVAVPGAAGYRIYVQPQGGSPTLAGEAAGASFDDLPPTDGAWTYTVTSLRAAGAASAESAPGPAVTVTSDRVPPGAPAGLALSLTGQGVVAAWSAPAGEPVTFRLLRGAAPIAAPEGATVVGTNIPGTTAVDPAPSLAEHYYAVVAADAVGNLSPPSPSEAINAALLPVSALAATRTGSAAPVVTWTHGAADLQGFRVTVDGAPVPALVPALGADPSFTDAAWAGGPRTYGVAAVDAADDASPERTVVLPDITATRTAGSVRRNVIGKLTYALTSPTPAAGVTLSLDLGAAAATAAPVSVGPAPTTVALIVAGAPSLPDTAAGTLRMAQAPPSGETVTLERPEPLPVTNDGYVLQVQAQELVRGAVAKVRLVLQNTSDVDAEIVTATGAGTKPSGEVRFRLEDTDGNVLATAALHQGLGEGVLQVPDGSTVGRAAPGQAFASAWTELPVPEAAPDTVVLRAVVDAVHHALGKPAHVQVPGPTTTHAASIVPPPWDAQVTSAEPAVSKGEAPIQITGQATLPGGAPAAGVAVRVTITLAGFQRTFDVDTAADGTFALPFQPPAAESGTYEVRAGYPGLGDTAPEATFVVQKVLVTPKAPKLTLATGYPATLTLTAQATPGLALTALRVETVQAPTGITVEAPAPQDVAGGTVQLPVVVTGGAPAPDASAFQLRVRSDEGTWAELVVAYTLTPAGPKLTWAPSFVQTGVARGDVVSETLTLKNEGTLVAPGVAVALLAANKTTAAPPWAFVASGKQVGDLPVGASAPVTLTFAPQPSTPLSVGGPTQLWLRVTALGQPPKDVPVYVTVDDSGVGAALFKVSDIYTATLGADGQLIEGLAGATVKLDKKTGTLQTVKATTDSKGEASFAELPAGTWAWRVSAAGHDAVTGTVAIKPGLTLPVDVFLPKPLVTVEWSVEETTIEDSYTVVLEATFETDVPAPVVVAEPASITLPPMDQGDVLYGEYTLTNHGLIRAEAITSKLPSAADYKFELLSYPPPDLEAKQSASVAYRVTRLLPKDPDGESSGGSHGCGIVHWSGAHCYAFWCANGVQSGGCTGVTWTSSSGGGGSGCDGGPWGWHGGAAGPGGPINAVDGARKCGPCDDPGMSAMERRCCREGKQQETGSTVDMITGGYEDEMVDLSIRTLGHTVTAARYWYDDAWHFGAFEADLGLADATCPAPAEGAGTSSATKAHIVHMGVVYEAPCVGAEAGTFSSGLATIRADGDGWRWEDASGLWRTFASSGALEAWGNRAGQAVHVERDAQGRIAAFRDHFGALAIAFEHAGGHVAAAETADGRRAEYTWQDGRLTQVDAGGQTMRYTYDGKGRLVLKQYPSGLVLAIGYDGAGNVASVLDADGAGWFFEYGYDAASAMDYVAVLGTDGHVRERWWDAQGALVEETVDGEPVPHLDPPSVADLDADGHVQAAYNLDGTLRTEWEYGPWGLPAEKTDARGSLTTWEWDDQGQLARHVEGAGTAEQSITEHTTDDEGRLVGTAKRGDGTVAPRAWSYTVDDRGLRTSVTDPLAQTTALEHDAAGHLTRVALPGGEVQEAEYDAAGRLVQLRVTPAGATEPVPLDTRTWAPRTDGEGTTIGQRVTSVDEDGQPWVTDLDGRGRPVKVTDPWGRTLQRSYDLQGRLAEETDPDGAHLQNTWEPVGFGLERQTVRVDGVVVATEERDRAGRLVARTGPLVDEVLFYDGGATQPSQRQGPGFTEATARDGFGLPVLQTVLLEEGAQAWTTTWENEGDQVMARTSPFGGRWSVTRDALGRITGATDPLGATTVYAWDAYGDLASVTDAAGRTVVAFTRDALGRITERALPGQTLTYERDAAGRLAAVESTAGTRIEYGVDARGRMSSQTATSDDPSVPPVTASYVWDSRDRMVSASTPEAAVTTVWDDAAGRRTTTVDFGPVEKTWGERRDARGRLVAETLPDGTDVAWGYGPDGLLAEVTVEGAGTLTVQADGLLARVWTTPDGTVVRHEHDGLGRLVHTTVTHGGATLLERRYVWEAYRLAAIETEHGDYAFGYDAADRLTDASIPTLEAFAATYDAVGNRASDGQGAWTYDALGRLATVGDAAFGWDDRGNLTSRTDTGATYVWNAASQLVEVQDGATTVATYGYGPDGERVRKTVGDTTTYAVWTERGLMAEYDADGVELRAYGYQPGAAKGMGAVFQRTAGQVAWFVLDHRGAPIALVQGGAVVWSVVVEPFGRAHPLVSAVDCPLRPSGQLADAETGLHLNGARHYDPRLGRFLSLDPQLEEQGNPNLYQFADASPLIREDTDGQKARISGGCSTSGSCNGGGGFSFGGYDGVGGEISGGAEVSTSDCCKDGQVIRNGQTCVKIKGQAEGGFGLGGSVGGARVGGKAATAGLGVECSRCNRCGEEIQERKCCGKAFIRGPSASAGAGFVGGAVSSGGLETSLCYDLDTGGWRFTPPTFQGPSGNVSGSWSSN